MSRNPFILEKLQKMRDNAAQRRKDKRINSLSSGKGLYAEVNHSKVYSKEDVENFRNFYKKEVLKEKRKTIAVLLLTLIITPIVFYLIFLFISSDWSIY